MDHHGVRWHEDIAEHQMSFYSCALIAVSDLALERALLGGARSKIGKDLRVLHVPLRCKASDLIENVTAHDAFGRVIDILQSEVIAYLEPRIRWQRKPFVLSAEAFLTRAERLLRQLALGDIERGT